MSLFNKRTDEYGGDLRGRLKFACDIVESIKEQCGESFPLLMSYGIKSYIKVADIISKQESKWKERKVNRLLPPVEILYDIQNILAQRYEDNMVKDMISYLTCELTNDDNRQAVTKFREALLSVIPKLCNAIDDMDYEEAHTAIRISRIRPKAEYKMFKYQMENFFAICMQMKQIVLIISFGDYRWQMNFLKSLQKNG